MTSTDDDLLKINISDGTLAWTYDAPTGGYLDPIVTDDAFIYSMVLVIYERSTYQMARWLGRMRHLQGL